MSISASPTTYDDAPDLELVKLSLAGEMSAFNLLVTRYRNKVYSMCYHLVQNEQDAWDLAQDTFLKAWKALPTFKGDASFYTWIYRIAHNSCYDFLRKKKMVSDGEFMDERRNTIAAGAQAVPQNQIQPDQALKNAELGMRIEQAIAQLSPEHRSVILLREVEGLSYEEIAQAVNATTGTVMSRLFYARKKLQELLQDAYENA